MLKLRMKILLTRIKVLLLKLISFSPILIKSKLGKSIAKDIVDIDFELKKNRIL